MHHIYHTKPCNATIHYIFCMPPISFWSGFNWVCLKIEGSQKTPKSRGWENHFHHQPRHNLKVTSPFFWQTHFIFLDIFAVNNPINYPHWHFFLHLLWVLYGFIPSHEILWHLPGWSQLPKAAEPAREQDEGGTLHQPRLFLTHVASSLIHHLHSLGIGIGIGIVPPRSWGIIWYHHPTFDCSCL